MKEVGGHSESYEKSAATHCVGNEKNNNNHNNHNHDNNNAPLYREDL